MKKFFLVISLFLIASCNSEEKHKAAAEQFYKFNYWMVNEPFQNAAAQADAKNNSVLGNPANCGYDIAVEIKKGLNEAHTLLAEAGTNISALIQKEIPQDQLEKANEYYKTTKVGNYISSQSGFMQMSEQLKNSPYNDEIRKTFETQELSPEQKFNVFINYTLKLLPEEEAKKYEEFNKLPLWEKLGGLGQQVDGFIKPFTTKTFEVGQLARKMAETCPEAAAPQATAPAPKAAAPAQPVAPVEAAPEAPAN